MNADDRPSVVHKLNRYCILCGKEWGPDFTLCCTANSLVRIQREGRFRKAVCYFYENGTRLDANALLELRAREQKICLNGADPGLSPNKGANAFLISSNAFPRTEPLFIRSAVRGVLIFSATSAAIYAVILAIWFGVKGSQSPVPYWSMLVVVIWAADCLAFVMWLVRVIRTRERAELIDRDNDYFDQRIGGIAILITAVIAVPLGSLYSKGQFEVLNEIVRFPGILDVPVVLSYMVVLLFLVSLIYSWALAFAFFKGGGYPYLICILQLFFLVAMWSVVHATSSSSRESAFAWRFLLEEGFS
jgi:hypothetical protein